MHNAVMIGKKKMADITAGFNIPFDKAIRYFTSKVQITTEDYAQISDEQHNHAFVVAGAMDDALVEDFYNSVKQAMIEGTGLAAFQENFKMIAEKHGWTYQGSADWRSKLIYQTNIQQAYNSGQYIQMQQVAHLRPFWRYRHNYVGPNPRDPHVAINNLVLAADDPAWDVLTPQNGFGCQCSVESMSRVQANRFFAANDMMGANTSPQVSWGEKTIGTSGSNPRTVKYAIVNTDKGEVAIDPGFSYNPAKQFLDAQTVPPLADAVAMTQLSKTPTDTQRQHVINFLAVFGATLDKGVVFQDAVGVPVVITKALFFDVAGDLIVGDDRLSNLSYIAQAIAAPDYIYQHWGQDSRTADMPDNVFLRWRLKRRYLKVIDKTLAVFEWSRKGWTASTSEVTKLKSFEVGTLVYKVQQ
jgi:phage-Barnase-EndoU-ColicinE5/D-RelE like nuclease2/Phage Mu protein F like protein